MPIFCVNHPGLIPFHPHILKFPYRFRNKAKKVEIPLFMPAEFIYNIQTNFFGNLY